MSLPYYHQRAHDLLDRAMRYVETVRDLDDGCLSRSRNIAAASITLRDLNNVLCAITGRDDKAATDPNPTISEKNCKHVLEVSDES